MGTGMTFYICPDCERKGLYFNWANGGNSVYICRHCGFFFYASGSSKFDAEAEHRTAAANPDGPFDMQRA